MYKQIKLLDGTIVDSQIKKVEGNLIIPFDPDNTDYQQYLAWLDAGNTPLPAETV
jgi:hypothetical protein